MASRTITRNYRDLCALTEYEQKIYDLRKQGLPWAEVAKKIGNVSEKSVIVRYRTIKEKVELQCLTS